MDNLELQICCEKYLKTENAGALHDSKLQNVWHFVVLLAKPNTSLRQTISPDWCVSVLERVHSMCKNKINIILKSMQLGFYQN